MPQKRWTEQEIADLMRMYPDPTITPQQMEQHFGRCWQALKQQAKLRKIRRRDTVPWSSEEVTRLKRMYVDEDIPQIDMMQQFGRTWKSITHKAQNLGLRRPRPNTCNAIRNYFHEINTDEKAYWLGFIAADGTVVSNGRQYSVVVDLQPGDLHWVKRFRDTIAPGATITRHGSRSCSVCIGSKEMVQDVMALGIGPRKSNTLEWPRIPESFVIPFLLGYFDGDGWLQNHPSRSSWLWGVTGTYPFLSIARDYIQHHANVTLAEPVRQCKDRSPHLYRITATGARAIAIDRLLNASGLGLPRKHLPPTTR